jgi:hypothetical protein
MQYKVAGSTHEVNAHANRGPWELEVARANRGGAQGVVAELGR